MEMDKTASIQLVAYPQKSRLQGGYPGMGPPLKQRAPQRASQQQVKGGGVQTHSSKRPRDSTGEGRGQWLHGAHTVCRPMPHVASVHTLQGDTILQGGGGYMGGGGGHVIFIGNNV